MNTLTWRLLTAEELTRVYLNEMRRDFPPTELKPLSMVLNSEAVGDSHTWGVYDGETLVAYLLMVRPRGATVSQLDYFAVLPACRAAGLGAKLLAALRNGWTGFVSGAQAVVVFLVGAWPAILIGAVCGVIYYRVRHPRKKK